MSRAALGFAAVALGALAAAALAAPPDAAGGAAPPPGSMADAHWDGDEMARARRALRSAAGGGRHLLLAADRLERLSGDGRSLTWDAQGWYGGDLGKLWVKTEGDYAFGGDRLEDAEVQLLWSRAASAFFDVQAGVRHDAEPAGVTYGVVGVQGLAPYWFELDAAAFVSAAGDLTLRLEAEYELRLSQRLVLQPRAELTFAAQRVRERGLGSGLAGIDFGARLRYEVRREFAPYLGVERQSAVGATGDLAEASGKHRHRTAVVVGLRAWF